MRDLRAAWVAGALVGLLAVVGLPSAARADITPVSSTPTVTSLGSGQYRYTWPVQVTGSTQVNLGDYFTLYDLEGYVSNSALTPNASWIFSQQLTGSSPPGVTPNDSSVLKNVTFTYCGSTPIVGPRIIGNFSIVSTIPTFRSQGANFAGSSTNSISCVKIANLTGIGAPSATPEPGTLLLVGAGLLGLIAGRRRASAAPQA